MQSTKPASEAIRPSTATPEGGFDGLRKMFDRLPKTQRATALACWDGFGDFVTPSVGGINHAAWVYANSRLNIATPSQGGHVQAYQLEKELGRVTADARALLSKLDRLSSVSRELLRAWLDEDAGLWEHDGMLVRELERLAQAGEGLAARVAARKQPRRGRRAKVAGRLAPVERLIFEIGQIVNFRKGKVTHILPIARVVHEWATGEVPGPTWGERPYDQVKAKLEALSWDEFSDTERIPPPAARHDPEAGKRRLERLKASLKAHPEMTEK